MAGAGGGAAAGGANIDDRTADHVGASTARTAEWRRGLARTPGGVIMTPIDRTEREAHIGAFLAEAGWGSAQRGLLAGDASFRRYDRLKRGAETAVLMAAPAA